ncbi:MAG: hypothetical protein ACYCZX_06900 [Rhodospirillaceae bacterium]
MKKFAIAALAASLALGTMAVSAPASAQSFGFSFNTGDVAFAYRDGYWDRYHNWHNWRSAREAREYRRIYRDRYYDSYHHRLRNMGWRDEDRDGVPNRYDRDRDGDGVPNRYDRRPDNPYRP